MKGLKGGWCGWICMVLNRNCRSPNEYRYISALRLKSRQEKESQRFKDTYLGTSNHSLVDMYAAHQKACPASRKPCVVRSLLALQLCIPIFLLLLLLLLLLIHSISISMSILIMPITPRQIRSNLIILLCIFHDLHVDIHDRHPFGTASQARQRACIRDANL